MDNNSCWCAPLRATKVARRASSSAASTLYVYACMWLSDQTHWNLPVHGLKWSTGGITEKRSWQWAYSTLPVLSNRFADPNFSSIHFSNEERRKNIKSASQHAAEKSIHCRPLLGRRGNGTCLTEAVQCSKLKWKVRKGKIGEKEYI